MNGVPRRFRSCSGRYFSHPARHVGRVGSDDDRRHLYRTRRGERWNRGGQYLCAAADGADGLRPDGGNGQFDNRISLPFEGQGPHGACECHPGAAFRDGRRSALGRRRHAFPEGTAYWLGSSERLLPMVVDYLVWFAPSMLFTLWTAVAMFALRLDGAPKLAMWCSLLAAFVNVVLDWLFIFLSAGA